METKFCKSCKQTLPISLFENHSDCRKCYKKEYYQRNKNRIKKRQKNYRDTKRDKKKEEGKFKWTASQKDEEEKFKYFCIQNNVIFDP